MKEFVSPENPRLLELLADRAAFGLDADDRQELNELLRESPEFESDSLELAAAALELAMFEARQSGREQLPSKLRARIAASAHRHLAEKDVEPEPLVRPARPSRSGTAEEVAQDSLLDSSRGVSSSLAVRPSSSANWLILAASVLLAVGVLFVLRAPGSGSIGDQYQRLLAASDRVSSEIVKAAWIDPTKPDDKQPRGDIVWSGSEQRGYMRFRGLAANDPKKEQYQLWIFDTAQDERFPIDGGVFDIDPASRDPRTGDVIVPIDAKLRVFKPTMFAITVEKPGGVVVSSRERLPLLAKVN